MLTVLQTVESLGSSSNVEIVCAPNSNMLIKLTVIGCLMMLTVLNSTPPADAFGFVSSGRHLDECSNLWTPFKDLLSQFTELLFGSDESDESSEMVINAKPNANVTVLCEKECNLNITCINCNKVDTVTMKPANGNGGNGGGNGGNGAAATTPAMASSTDAAPTTVSGR